MSEKTYCRGCGREVIWGVTADNVRVPLDPRPAVYEVYAQDRQVGRAIARLESAMVTHFATCVKANEFSGSKKKVETAAE